MSSSEDKDDSEAAGRNGGHRAPRRTWEEGYRDLKTFFEEHGHSRPKASSLVGRWAADQRKKRLQNELSAEQIRLLDEIHYDWESQNEKLENQWQQMFELLKKYKLQHGHTRVPQKELFEGASLGNWVTSQQSLYRENKIKAHRKELLETIGFEWIRDERLLWKDTRPLGKFDDDWNEKLGALCEYKDEVGDTLVSCGYMVRLENGNEFDLGAFVTRQRQLHRDGLLRKEREEQLQRIGFVFAIDIYDAEASKHQKAWDDMFNRLCTYKEQHGDCNIPAKDEEDPELGRWAREQRARYARGELAENRFQCLDDLGFTWAPHEERRHEMVEHLRAYKHEHGDCEVPDSYQTKDGTNLGSWVRTVRGARRGTRGFELAPEKIAQLDALGFIWENMIHRNWDIMYNALRRYKQTHGHCRVPQAYKGDTDDLPTSLGQWVSLQRQSLERKVEETGDQMYLERRKRLNSIGFDWSLAHIPQEKWDTMFERLVHYEAQYGDCRVPYSYEDDCDDMPRKLGGWVSAQRSVIPAKVGEGNAIFVERKQRLDDIGFLWEDNAAHENWMKMFERLKQFHAECGNCRVPSGYDRNCDGLPAKLGNWVAVQKSTVPTKAENGHPVYVERKMLLDSLNFEFDHVHEAQWEDMFQRLKQYHSVNGHCRVPTTYDDGNGGTKLSSWVRNQRNVLEKAKSGDLKYVARKTLLDSLHFEFDTVDKLKWLAMFDVLKKFVEKHGHCNVPLSYGDDDQEDSPRALGRWCHEQRRAIPAGLKKANANNDYSERKRMLDSVAFRWTIEFEKDKKWNAFFERLKKFKETHGHCFVPPDYESGESSLYGWVRNQQSKILSRAESGNPEFIRRKELLDSIGFEWKRIFDDNWEKMYLTLVKYRDQHGHCRVPYRGEGAVDGPTGQLGIWVYKQRTNVPVKATEGDPVYVERKQRLDAIGFEWLDVHSGKWEVMFAGLQRFHEEHGHCRVKRDYKDKRQPLPANLGSWLSSQRQQIPEKIEQGDEVAIERKRRLDALGFVWQTRAPPKKYVRHGKIVEGRKVSSTISANEKTPASNLTGPSDRKGDGADSSHEEGSDQSEGAPGPDGTLVAFPDYDGNEEPVMWKKAFGQFRRRLRNDVKQSLDASERTKERVTEILKDRWSQLSENEKDVYRKWAKWDKKRYERDVVIFGQQKPAAARAPEKRKLPSEEWHTDMRKKKRQIYVSEDLPTTPV